MGHLDEFHRFEQETDQKHSGDVTSRLDRDHFYSPDPISDYNLDKPMMKRSQSNKGFNQSIGNTSRQSLFGNRRRSASG